MPLQLFTGEIPKLRALIPFRAKGYKHIPKELRTKWKPNSVACIFTEYAKSNQFRVLIDRKIHITRDLTISKTLPEIEPDCQQDTYVHIQNRNKDNDNTIVSVARIDEPKPPIPEPPEPEDLPPLSQTLPQSHTPSAFSIDTPLDATHVHLTNSPAQENPYTQCPRRSNAGKYTTTQFHDKTFLVVHQHSGDSPAFHTFPSISTTEPSTYMKAISGPHYTEWREVIVEELTSLNNNKTWVLTELPID
ncbi:hypothetical protein HOY80DRAFT_1040565 [Tuber brumale]|nr:hypothetical protein HOY80DRAFT_1040565 [Tuber brumale]